MGRSYITVGNLIQLNERLNKWNNKSQGRVRRDILENIVRDAKAQKTLEDAAVTYFFRIVREHPFIGANKRTASLAAGIFLEMNGCVFRMPLKKFTKLSRRVRSGEVDEAQVRTLFEKAIKKRRVLV